MIEIHDLAEFDRRVETSGNLAGVVVQGVDLSERTSTLHAHGCSGTVFLGCSMTAAALEAVIGSGAVVFPDLPDLPFDPYRPRLYDQAELLAGWSPDEPGSFDAALDSRIYRWTRAASSPTVLDALARRLHDHAIDDALEDHLSACGEVVAVMGGHSMRRNDDSYRTVAQLGRAMAREGWHVATGGGPGAMEAANLGAWLAPSPDAALDQAIDMLSESVDYRDADAYLAAGAAVVDRFEEGAASLAVPTWFYGHEPTNQFATHVAKYFANSIREDGLLAIASRGVVFAPGAAGTTQEVFQDATQNHYQVFGNASPMVFLDRNFWTTELPAEPLLRTLAGDRPYAALIGSADDAAEAIEFLRSHPPVEASAT